MTGTNKQRQYREDGGPRQYHHIDTAIFARNMRRPNIYIKLAFTKVADAAVAGIILATILAVLVVARVVFLVLVLLLAITAAAAAGGGRG